MRALKLLARRLPEPMGVGVTMFVVRVVGGTSVTRLIA